MNYMQEQHRSVESDILSGRGFDILVCLMNKNRTLEQIADKLGTTEYTANSYLTKLQNVGLVSLKDNGEYELQGTNLELSKDLSEEKKTELVAQHFGVLVRDAIVKSKKRKELPQKVETCFLKANIEDIEGFKKDIEELFEKYKALENTKEETTFSLFAVLTPYDEE